MGQTVKERTIARINALGKELALDLTLTPDLQVLATKLSSYVGKAWSWNYLTNIINNNYDHPISKPVLKALDLMEADIDGVPPIVSDTVPVQTFAKPDTVKSGSVILTPSRICSNPTCKISFIPKVHNQTACGPRCARAVRRIKYRSKT